MSNQLSQAALDLLSCEDARHSEWATACAIGMYAMNAEYTEDEFIQLVLESDFAYVFATEDKGRDRSNRLERRLRKVWARVEDGWNPPLRETTNVRERLEALSQRIADHDWPGRTASTDRAVALALVQWAHEIGVWTLGAGTRELALRASVVHATAKKALGRLAAVGLIKPSTQTKRKPNHCQRWELDLDWGIMANIDPYGSFPPGVSSYGLNVAVNHPVFLGSALGPTAGRVWMYLAEHQDGARVEAIAEGTGISDRTLRRVLAEKLVPNGLVVAEVDSAGRGRPAQVYRLDPNVSLDEIAESFGVLGWHERTAERYERERAGFREVQRQIEQHKRERFDGELKRHRAEWAAFVDSLPKLKPGKAKLIRDPFHPEILVWQGDIVGVISRDDLLGLDAFDIDACPVKPTPAALALRDRGHMHPIVHLAGR
jgi:predicted transcriptional regulator